MNDADDLRALVDYGPTEEETTWARKLHDLVTRAGERPWSRDDERLSCHYQDQLAQARAEGVVVRSRQHAKTQLGKIAELLED